MPTDQYRPSRRTLAKGAAWTAPILLAAAPAPAIAASACAPATLNWNNVPSGAFNSTVIGKTTITATANVTSGSGITQNGSVVSTQQGGITGNLYALGFNSPTANGPSQTVTFTFTPAVSDLSFTLLDLDTATPNGWKDQVRVNTPGFTYTAGSTVSGAGTNASPFAGTANVAPASTTGNVILNYASSVTSVNFTYFNGNVGGGGSMIIAVSNLTFTPSAC